MVTLNRIGLIIYLLILGLFNSAGFASEDFDDSIPLSEVVRARHENSKNLAQEERSKEEIPEFSEVKKNEIAQELNASSADDLKKKGAMLRDEYSQKDPDGIMATMIEVTDIKKVTGDNCKGCENYGELKMFTDADLYMQDPISQMDLIKSQGCPEENENQGFVKQDNIESFTDIIEELRICEQPKTKFSCTRTLSLSCPKIGEANYGGIAKGKFSEGMIYNISKGGSLTIGRDGDNYYLDHTGQCSTFYEIVSFHITKLDLLSVFKVKRLKFDDYIEMKLNGHIIYVGPDGGEYVRVEQHDGKNMVFNGNYHSECERAIDQDQTVQIDLKPYLKEGENVLEIKLIVGGAGEMWLEIDAKQKYCKDNAWKESWVESCE